MKKSLLLICACLILTSAGCSSKNSSSGNSSSSIESSISESAESESTESDSSQDDAVGAANLDTKVQGWGQGTNFDDSNRPVDCLTFQEKYGQYDALFIRENAEKQIYLTFDQGYENGYTEKILDILKEKEVSAVFFVLYDYVDKNPDLVQRMIDEGHVIGNHSYSHPSMPSLSIEEQQEEITKLHQYMIDEFSYEMTLFRPPKGEFSEQSLSVAQSLGYKTVFWSYAYADWDPDNQPDTAESLDKAVQRAHDGAIYLLHSVGKTNSEILEDLIDNLQAQDYSLEKLQ